MAEGWPGSMSSECRTQSPDPLTSHCWLASTARISHGFLSRLKYHFIKISSYNEVTTTDSAMSEPSVMFRSLVTWCSLMLDVTTKLPDWTTDILTCWCQLLSLYNSLMPGREGGRGRTASLSPVLSTHICTDSKCQSYCTDMASFTESPLSRLQRNTDQMEVLHAWWTNWIERTSWDYNSH